VEASALAGIQPPQNFVQRARQNEHRATVDQAFAVALVEQRRAADRQDTAAPKAEFAAQFTLDGVQAGLPEQLANLVGRQILAELDFGIQVDEHDAKLFGNDPPDRVPAYPDVPGKDKVMVRRYW